MFYIIYKITNQIDGKFYIGSHKTKNLNDNYMGSGKYLKRAQEKYGIENFTKEILFIFDTAEKMYAKEAEIVNEDFLTEKNTYNLKIGGLGGFDHLNDGSKKHIDRCKSARGCRKNYSVGGWNSIVLAKKSSNLGKTRQRELYPNGTFGGKKHNDETKKKIALANSKKQTGDSNSQYGTRWIYSMTEKVSKKINNNDEIPHGWTKGRKIKFN